MTKTVISIDRFKNEHHKIPETLKDRMGFDEEALMVQLTAGAVKLLESIPTISHCVEVIKFQTHADPQEFGQFSIYTRFTVIFDIEGWCEDKLSASGTVRILRQTGLREGMCEIGHLAESIRYSGVKAVSAAIRRLDMGLEAELRKIRQLGEFALDKK